MTARLASPVLALGLLFSLAPRHAAAQDDATERARAHFELGVRLVEQSRWSDAARELENARAIRATAPVLYNLGIAYRAVGRLGEAIAVFHEFVELLGAEGSPERQAEVRGYIGELTTRLARLRVVVEPAGASVRVGERALDGEQIELDPGTHRIRVAHPGHIASEEEVTLEAGEARILEITLEAARTRLYVNAGSPAAVVVLDGVLLGPVPIDDDVRPGAHVLEVRAPGHETIRREFTLRQGEVLRWRADLSREADDLLESPWLWIGGAASILAIGAAILIGVLAGSGTEDPYVGDLGLVTGVLLRGP